MLTRRAREQATEVAVAAVAAATVAAVVAAEAATVAAEAVAVAVAADVATDNKHQRFAQVVPEWKQTAKRRFVEGSFCCLQARKV